MVSRRKEGHELPGGSIAVWKLFRYADSMDVWLTILGVLGAIGDGLSIPIVMFIMSSLVDTIGSGPSSFNYIRTINRYSAYMVYVGVCIFFAAFLEGFCWTRTGERQAARMRKRYLKAVLRQDVGFFDTRGPNTSEVIVSVSNDTLVIQDVLSEKLPNFIVYLASFVGNYIVALYLSWKLALVALPFVVILVIPGFIYGRILVGIARKMSEAYDVAGSVAQEALSSIRTVYAFVAEEKTHHQFSSALNVSARLGLKMGFVKGMAMGSTGVTFCTWAFISWYGSRLVMYDGVSGGKVFVAGATMIIGGLSLGNAIPSLRNFSEAGTASKRIFEMVERVPAIDSEDPNGRTLSKVRGEVDFRDVEFAYPSRPETKIFEKFCVNIPAGKTIALVGGSGSGKSTAIALLARFYDPLSGEILLDGVNIKELQLKWLRSQIGLVSQEPALFAMSIKDNILFGKEGATMDEIVAATMAANAHSFISQLPDGYDTQAGERGAQISGGQKQRIAIARAILKNPPLLLLDEATSALDAESEKTVQEALEHASVGRTTIIVAHRLSTIRNADAIAVIHCGQIIEMGTHNDLVQNENGSYAAMLSLQKSTENENETDAISFRETSLRNSSSKTDSTSMSATSNSAIPHPCDTKQLGLDKIEAPAPSMRRLLAMNAKEWKQALLGSVGALCFGAVQPSYAYILGSAVSVFFQTDHNQIKSKIRLYSLLFLSLGVISFLVNLLQHYNFAAMGEYLTKRVRVRMLAKILTFEIGWFDREENSSGAICSRLATEANTVKSLVSDRISLIVQTVSVVIIAYSLGLAIAWRLAVIMIAVQPLAIFSYYIRKTCLQIMSKKALKAQNEGSQLAAEAVSNHRTVTAFCSQERILTLFENTQKGPCKNNIRQSWVAGIVLGSAQFIHMGTLALDFWYGAHLVHKGLITSKHFFQTLFILMSTGRVIADAGTMTSDLAKGADAVKTVFSILDRDSEIIPDDFLCEKPEKIEGEIELRNVDFAYPARPDTIVLKAFSLQIKAGSSMALVGHSGCGKSTIISLIERFYDPTKGTVKIDGIELKNYNLRSIRRHIGLVGQEPVLFAGSIRDNIIYGKDNANESEVIEAARAANAHEFITQLQNGYDTECGEKGVQLSGGQKQRIAIARAILRDPRILLLDEATSALDSHSEKIVQETLDRVMVGRTSVVIAHRLSSVQNAQCIAVIEDGKVVEAGNHHYLIGRGPGYPYFSLFQMHQANHL